MEAFAAYGVVGASCCGACAVLFVDLAVRTICHRCSPVCRVADRPLHVHFVGYHAGRDCSRGFIGMSRARPSGFAVTVGLGTRPGM